MQTLKPSQLFYHERSRLSVYPINMKPKQSHLKHKQPKAMKTESFCGQTMLCPNWLDKGIANGLLHF